jgi:hypothetical protein
VPNAWQQSRLRVCFRIDGVRFVSRVNFDAECHAGGGRGCINIRKRADR